MLTPVRANGIGHIDAGGQDARCPPSPALLPDPVLAAAVTSQAFFAAYAGDGRGMPVAAKPLRFQYRFRFIFSGTPNRLG
jgi:hypothetical protein